MELNLTKEINDNTRWANQALHQGDILGAIAHATTANAQRMEELRQAQQRLNMALKMLERPAEFVPVAKAY